MKKKRMWTVTALLMPLILAIVWLVYIIVAKRTFILSGGAQLAPVRDIEPLMIGLGVFITGYIIFMFMMFSEDIKEMWEKRKAIQTKETKKRK